MSSFRQRAWASLGATAGMFALPTACVLLDTYGPSSRVVFWGYLPFQSVATLTPASLIGLALGARLRAATHRAEPRYSELRLAAGCLLGAAVGLVVMAAALLGSGGHEGVAPMVLMGAGCAALPIGTWAGGALFFRRLDGAVHPLRPPRVRLAALALLIVAVLIPQVLAFPSHGTLAERDRWARRWVKEYAALAELISNLPVVTDSVGRVVEIAPTAGDSQFFGRDMNGDDMRFTFEVVGESGHGVFRADCTMDSGIVLGWRSGRWIFNGVETSVEVTPVIRR